MYIRHPIWVPFILPGRGRLSLRKYVLPYDI
nr:MAG TPA: hypothetical protein [Caudoviricetes sp.]